jgi:hypothetical protein
MSIPSLTFHPQKCNSRTEMGWWIEIFSAQPPCLYFFGPFNSDREAQASQAGFVQDLIHEGAQGLAVRLQWCQPSELTVTDRSEAIHFWEFPPGVTLV